MYNVGPERNDNFTIYVRFRKVWYFNLNKKITFVFFYQVNKPLHVFVEYIYIYITIINNPIFYIFYRFVYTFQRKGKIVFAYLEKKKDNIFILCFSLYIYYKINLWKFLLSTIL